MQVVLLSPIDDDVHAGLRPQRIRLRPATDTAIMLALCHVLVAEDLHDRAFLDRCCAGVETFLGDARRPDARVGAGDLRRAGRDGARSRATHGVAGGR